MKCKNCVNLCADWCDMKADSPDPELERDCHWFAQKTNADRIRAMSDDELAKWRSSGQCPAGHYHGYYDCMIRSCEDCWLDWLKQEATDGNSPDNI